MQLAPGFDGARASGLAAHRVEDFFKALAPCPIRQHEVHSLMVGVEQQIEAVVVQRLAATYLGPGVKFPPGDNPPSGWLIHIVPESWHGYGPWSKPDNAERERRQAAHSS